MLAVECYVTAMKSYLTESRRRSAGVNIKGNKGSPPGNQWVIAMVTEIAQLIGGWVSVCEGQVPINTYAILETTHS